jgi:hypothetical protein
VELGALRFARSLVGVAFMVRGHAKVAKVIEKVVSAIEHAVPRCNFGSWIGAALDGAAFDRHALPPIAQQGWWPATFRGSARVQVEFADQARKQRPRITLHRHARVSLKVGVGIAEGQPIVRNGFTRLLAPVPSFGSRLEQLQVVRL